MNEMRYESLVNVIQYGYSVSSGSQRVVCHFRLQSCGELASILLQSRANINSNCSVYTNINYKTLATAKMLTVVFVSDNTWNILLSY